MKYGLSKWSLRNRLILVMLALASTAILASDLSAETLLRSYLVKEVDTQLLNVTENSLLRLDRAGIAQGDEDGAQGFKPLRPLGSVPSQVSVTLLDLSGAVVGQIGGEIENYTDENMFSNLTPSGVSARAGKPFTLGGEGSVHKIRAIARILPSGIGTAVISVSLDSVDKTLKELTFVFLLISLLVLLAIGVIGFLTIRLSLRPLSNIEDIAAQIAGGDLSARLPEVNSKTEVGRLTGSLNSMLSRIEESFAIRKESENKLRRFVADASHELRTPLTAIRGFAELHRQGAVTGDQKVAELVARIEKESIRMGALVEDLLLLARLDQTPQVATDPVDLNHLVSEAVESARAAGKDHPIKLDLGDTENFILGDSMRIHQVVANLLANARTHTPANTQIEVSIRHESNEILIVVKDFGPGLSEEDQTRIFERFFRADPSRVRISGEGSGLGLSIVDAVMKSHGGSVSVESELGKSATFTLHFPVAAN